jgi:glycine/D-amino acid oxidase-like deaminating enzyme
MWMDAELPRFGPLAHDLSVDVAVIGGGLTGITTTYLLAREGRRVALFERGRLASGDTARSTAHLTYVTDLRLQEAVERFGAASARAHWEAGMAGIGQIARTVDELRIDCDFRWTPGYLHAPAGSDGDGVLALRRDAELAASFGFDARYVESVPGVGRPGVRFGGQACFHPRKYAAALLSALVADGGQVFESSPLQAREAGAQRLTVNGHDVACSFAVNATQERSGGFRDRVEVYTSYVVAARQPSGTTPPALYWDTADPYEYLRVDPLAGAQSVLFGGCDVRSDSGADAGERFKEVTARLKERLPDATVTHGWEGQLVVSDDGLPFIGMQSGREFIATAFCGNGFTLGTVGAMMARDAHLLRPNAWSELFSPHRPAPHRHLWQTVTRLISRAKPDSDRSPRAS